MTKTAATSALLILLSTSCGLLRKYSDNETVQFDKCLTENERQQLLAGKVIYKYWNGTYKDGAYSKGLLQIRVNSLRKNRYHFVKNGPWREYHKTTNNKYIKVRENYDRFGNKLTSELYLSPPDTTAGFILWTAEALDTTSMTVTYKQYYDDGKLKYILFGRPVNYHDVVSEYAKGMETDSMQAFSPTGAPVAPDKMDTYNRLYYMPTRCQ